MTNEAELAEALPHYIDPTDPEFDPGFTAELYRIRPDWFTPDEKAAYLDWLRVGLYPGARPHDDNCDCALCALCEGL